MNHLRRYEPLNILNDISRLFEHTVAPQTGRFSETDSSSLENSQWIPAVDVKEKKDRFEIKVDLPGINKEDIQIAMENGVLSVEGKRNEEKKEEGDNYYRIERVSGKFYRRFALPETADEEKIQANIKKGILEINIPKKAASKSRAIEIKEEE
ncbi:MAG: hspA 7 [Gammaproteobacteria bacterium]|jgi:HSP20 family protein|nr:hspA 7 [Gammaproteobacteria bacterium]